MNIKYYKSLICFVINCITHKKYLTFYIYYCAERLLNNSYIQVLQSFFYDETHAQCMINYKI